MDAKLRGHIKVSDEAMEKKINNAEKKPEYAKIRLFGLGFFQFLTNNVDWKLL